MQQAQFLDHPLWEEVHRVLELISPYSGEEPVLVMEIRTAARRVLAQRETPRDTAPTFSASALGAMRGAWRELHSQLDAFWTIDGHPRQQVLDAFDEVLTLLLPWPDAAKGSKSIAQKSLHEYQAAAESALNSLAETEQSNREALEAELTAARGEIAGLTEKLAQLDALATDAALRFERQVERLDTALTTNNEAFIAAQSERDSRFRSTLDDVDVRVQSTISELRNDGTAMLADTEMQLGVKLTAADDVVDSMAATQEQVESLAAGITGSVLARDYGTHATREFVAAIIGYAVGVVILVCMAIDLARTLDTIKEGDAVSWQFVAIKLGLTTAAAAAAAVAIQFGSRSMGRSDASKRTELELRAIVPFLADVDPAQSAKARIEFVDRSFGQRPGEVDADDAKGLVEAFAQFVKALPRQ